jgi:hypothetical protein
MGEGTSSLRDRMVRHAIVDLLSELAGPADAGGVLDVRVDGDSVRVELRLPGRWPALAGTVDEVERRLRSLPEVARSHVVVVVEQGVSN